MEEAALADSLQEFLASIDDFRSLVNEVPINKSVFLKCAFFLMELKQVVTTRRDWPADAVQLLVDDIKALQELTKQMFRFKSRVFLLYKSPLVIQGIKDISKVFANHLQLLGAAESLPSELQEQLLELRKRLENSSFSADSGTGELAAALSRTVSETNGSSENWHNLSEELARQLSAPLPSLRQELLEDKRMLQAEGAETAELEKILFLLENAAPESTGLAFEDPSADEGNIPQSFFCPITGQIMREPVLVEGGVSYEKSAILEWLSRGNTRCPITNLELNSKDLVLNRSLQNTIRQHLDRLNVDKLTRSIKKIKEEPIAEAMEAIDNIKDLIELNSNFKRHVVALDGLKPLLVILKRSDPEQRNKVLQILGSIAATGDDCKLRMIKAGAVPILLRILTKCHGDNLDAVNVLLRISETEGGRDAILAEQGSVITLASAVNIESTEQKTQAAKIVENLCRNNSWVIIEAASAGLFEPLVKNLGTANDRLKLEMAEAIVTKLELNEASSADLVSAGVVAPLIEMLKSESFANKLAAAGSLHKLSAVENNRRAIGEESDVIPLLVNSLLSAKDQDFKLRLLGTLANLATVKNCAAAMNQEDAALRFLHLVQHKDPQIQGYALTLVHFLAKESRNVRLSFKEHREGLRYIITLFQDAPAGVRRSILGLLFQLSVDRATREAVQPSQETIALFVKLLEQPVPVEDKELILGILGGITKNGRGEIAQILVSGNHCAVIIKCLETGGSPKLKEGAVAVLTRLTDPDFINNNNNLNQQLYAELAARNIMQLLRQTLMSGTERAREHAAANLAHLSRCTPSFTEKQSYLKRILAKLGIKQYRPCLVHAGKCNPRTSFCLVEAGVVPLLIGEIGNSDNNIRNAERGMDALFTLIQDESSRVKAVDYLVKNNIINAVVGLVGKSASTTEKAVAMLERIFKCRKYRDDRYSKLAKSSLSTTMTSGSLEARKSAAKALMHLGMMPKGSTYSATDNQIATQA